MASAALGLRGSETPMRPAGWSVEGDEEDGLSLLPECLGGDEEGCGVDVEGAEEAGGAGGDFPAAATWDLNGAGDALAGEGAEVPGGAERSALGGLGDGGGEGVFARLLEGGGEVEEVGDGGAGLGGDGGEGGFAEGEGAGLVEDEGVDLPRGFQGPRRCG